jgi:hypothetical protein
MFRCAWARLNNGMSTAKTRRYPASTGVPNNPARGDAASGAALDEAERVLHSVVGKPAELVWKSPSNPAVPSVFDVVQSRLDHVMDDLGERSVERHYTLALNALPGARPEDKVITTAAPSGGTTTSIDTCDLATGWSSTYDPTVVSTGGYVTATSSKAGSLTGWSLANLIRTGSVAFATTPYLTIELWHNGNNVTLSAASSAGSAPMVALTALSGGWLRATFDATGHGTVSSVKFTATDDTGTVFELRIRDVLRSTGIDPGGLYGSARQQARTLDVGGSLRSVGSLSISHATSALGSVLVFTHPVVGAGGYTPPLRRWRFSSDAITIDATQTSGAWNSITNAIDYRIPVDNMPSGKVALWARLWSNTAGTFRIVWAADAWMGGVQVGETQSTHTNVTWATAETWIIAPLTIFSLPTARIGSAGFNRISLLRDPAHSASVLVDEAWLFALDKGRLTHVECGTAAPAVGGASNRLWIDAPSLDDPIGGMQIGTAVDRTDAYAPAGAKVLSEMSHTFDPGGTMVFTVTSNALSADVALEHYPRFHTHVVGVA